MEQQWWLRRHSASSWIQGFSLVWWPKGAPLPSKRSLWASGTWRQGTSRGIAWGHDNFTHTSTSLCTNVFLNVMLLYLPNFIILPTGETHLCHVREEFCTIMGFPMLSSPSPVQHISKYSHSTWSASPGGGGRDKLGHAYLCTWLALVMSPAWDAP